MKQETQETNQEELWTDEAAKKWQFFNPRVLLLLPIADELCPKTAERLAYYSNMEYALQGTIIAEIRRLKQQLTNMEKRVKELQSLQFGDEWFKSPPKT